MPKLVSPTGRPILLDSILPNVGIECQYREYILVLVEQMQRSVMRSVREAYKQSGLAMDASQAQELRDAVSKMARRWQKRFDVGAQELAAWFAKSTKKRTDAALDGILRKAGFSVRFRMSEGMQNAYDAVIGEQVGLIKSIASQHLTRVETLVMQSVQQGRNLGALTTELEKAYGVTQRRAALIARDQNNKATATLQRARRLELGITQARWRHSNAGKDPRPEHVAANGKIYEIQKGMYLEGVWTWPGHEINCRCSDQAIIPSSRANETST